MPYRIEVIPMVHVARPHRGTFSYLSPQKVSQGSIVEIPFGKRLILGVVAATGEKIPKASPRLKWIQRILVPYAFLPDVAMRYLSWESQATLTPLGDILARAIPAWVRRQTWVASLQSPPLTPHKHVDSHRQLRLLYCYASDQKRRQAYAKFIRAGLQKNRQILVLAPTRNAQASLFESFKHIHRCILAPQGKTRSAKEMWWRIRSGEPLCVIGTASALRLPLSNLSHIVLDDESNALWKETRMHPYTDARIAARKLAALHDARSVTGGLLPTIATVHDRGLKLVRVSKPSGKFLAIDLKGERPRDGFTPTLLSAIGGTPQKKRRARILLFVNRRGTAPLLRCKDCDFVFTCPSCEAPMPVFKRHAEQHELRCRHCGAQFIPPLVCPSCRGFRLAGAGTGTEKTQEVLKNHFPDLEAIRLDGDATPTAHRQRLALDRFRNAQNDAALIATAMALHAPLPPLDLVAVPAFEQFLAMPDFSTEESAWETMIRLASFLKPKGTLVLQTWRRDSAFLKKILANDFRTFVREELKMRKQFEFPPFRRLAKLTYAHRDAKRAESEAQMLSEHLRKTLSPIPRSLSIKVEDPYPAFISRVRGKYIWHILVKWKPANQISYRNPSTRFARSGSISRSPSLRSGARNENDLRVEDRLWEAVPPAWDVEVNPLSLL